MTKKTDQTEVQNPPGSDPGEIRVTDRRFWVKKDWDPNETAASRLPSVLENLQEEIRKGEARVQEIREAARQLQSETDAVRTRLERDVERKVANARAQFLSDLLEVVDNLERSLEAAQKTGQKSAEPAFTSLVEGIQMVRILFLEKLARQGVEKLTVLDALFNPETAEALEVAATDDPQMDNRVVGVFQEGYQMNGRTIRPAKVKIAKLASGKGNPTEEPKSEDVRSYDSTKISQS